MHTSTIDGKIYSVEMAIMWANLYGKKEKIKLMPKILKSLGEKGWFDENEKKIAPIEVLADHKISPMHWKKIREADLKYPILVHNSEIFDGVHRLCKAVLEDKKEINVIKIPKKVLDKFYIGSSKNFWKDPIQNVEKLVFDESSDVYQTLVETLFNLRFS